MINNGVIQHGYGIYERKPVASSLFKTILIVLSTFDNLQSLIVKIEIA